MFYFENLLTKLKTYLSSKNIDNVITAYKIAQDAHKDQIRISGSEYITHPLAVAEILADLKLDYKTIMAAMLHDVLEDTKITKNELEKLFGSKVVELVDGVSKLNKIDFASRLEAQAVNFQKMILATTKDVRVVIIKLADRLHNMRTLGSLPFEKQQRIAKETLEIYAPIAAKLGLHVFKVEFEDLSFSYLYPSNYKTLQESLKNSAGYISKTNSIKQHLTMKLKSAHIEVIDCIIDNKHVYDIYKKIRKKIFSLTNITHTLTLKIIVSTTDECYRTLGIVHKLYKPVHEHFKDYIAIPKSNHYQALHTTINIPNGPHLEVQIYTQHMYQVAEYGVIVHLTQQTPGNNMNDINQKQWLTNLVDLQYKSNDSIEFLENVKTDLHHEEIYVFTPQGDIISLPAHSTIVDFAYAVHTDLGNSCVAAKINQKLTPLSTKLTSGQSIEIIVAKGSHPNPLWLNFVTTVKARSSIRHWLKMQQVEESCLLGEKLLTTELANLSLTLANIHQTNIQELLHELHLSSMSELFTEIGLGNQLSPLIARKLIEPEAKHDVPNTSLVITGAEGMILNYSDCCHPIPGDKIIGIFSAGRGINIHREDCAKVINSIITEQQEQHVFLKWSKDIKATFLAEICISTLNEPGVLGSIGNTIANNNSNIQKIKMNDADPNHGLLNLLLTTHNIEHLEQIINALIAIPQITSVIRL